MPESSSPFSGLANARKLAPGRASFYASGAKEVEAAIAKMK